MDIKLLAAEISNIHEQLYKKAVSAINISLTIRNWLIGCYIVEYEQNGKDRAKYGETIVQKLSEKLIKEGINGMSATNLKIYRQFYLIYPQISQTLSDQLIKLSVNLPKQLENTNNKNIEISETLSDQLLFVPPQKILTYLSFSHIAELIKIEDSLKRSFYEIECMNGTWSIRELKRQIASLCYERSGMSANKEKLSSLINNKAEQLQPKDMLKNPMAFEFLDIPAKEVVHETTLETALIENLQEFLIELGNGFCFEARQKRILIDDEYFYIDLVFYHRILKCHVLVELKADEFSHQHAGQLNAYLQHYKHKIMSTGDNEPIGILLCTKSKKTMVKYATTANKNLFVNEYLIKLPSENKLKEFIERKIQENK